MRRVPLASGVVGNNEDSFSSLYAGAPKSEADKTRTTLHRTRSGQSLSIPPKKPPFSEPTIDGRFHQNIIGFNVANKVAHFRP